MKKLLLTLIVSLALSVSAFAQYESHWPGFDYHAFDDQGGFVAAIKIDDVIINVTDANWDALEVAAFVGDECRGNENYLYGGYVEEYGDPFPVLDGIPIYFTTNGETVSFKMYDHLNEVEYTSCEIIYNGAPIEILTGEEHYEGWDDPENPIYLCFTSSEPTTVTLTKDIVGYGESEGGFYLIACPFNGVDPTTVEGMVDGTYDLYYFDQVGDDDGNEWMNYEAEAFNLTRGMGYLYANQEGVTLSFTGMPEEGTVEVALAYDEDAAQSLRGWNLVGNPFTVDAYLDGGMAFYVMNEAGDDVEAASGDCIAPLEGIFVTTEDDGEILTFTTDPAGGKGASLVMDVTQNRGASIDRAILRFGNDSQLPKFMLNQNHTKVYIPQNGKDYAVVSASEMGEMPVNFKAEHNGTYSLNFSKDTDFSYLHLIDNLTGNDVDLLANPSYSFDAKTTDYASRFRLVFATGNSDDNFGFFSDGNLIINNDGEATLQVVDINGRIISSENISGSCSVQLNAAAGVYMLRLVNGNNAKVQKIVVK